VGTPTSDPLIDCGSRTTSAAAVWEHSLDPERRDQPGQPRFTCQNGLAFLETGQLSVPRRGDRTTDTTPSAMEPVPKGGRRAHFRIADEQGPEGTDGGVSFPRRFAVVASCGSRQRGSAVARADRGWPTDLDSVLS
jgi:hypothetical protein